ncbi:hypothetical protein A9Q98_14330 [Thalassotalea sp. 42_200_T64]|nr:hypothetical protein A9Q98_14330 [Thalassotalea sp. 42_200_T64]
MFKNSLYFFILCLFTVQNVFAAVESSESIKENSHHINTHKLHDQSHQHGQVNTNQHDYNGSVDIAANTDLDHDHQQADHESCHAHFHFHPTMLTELVSLNPTMHQQEVIAARKLATEKNITSLYRPPIA